MSAARTKTKKIRLNLALSRSAIIHGKQLARLDNRSFSNKLEVLIETAFAQIQASLPPENGSPAPVAPPAETPQEQAVAA